MNSPDYRTIAADARKKVLELIYKAQTSHIGSNFSAIDIMAVLFEKIDLEKDEFVLSAGWKAAALYYFLWRKGRITEEEFNSYCQPGSKFIGLAEPIIPEIKIAGGSMGLGLPGAVGLALAKKLKGEDGKVYCLMSDGELQIGTTWESALIAAQHNLDNLIVLADFNGYQAMGKTEDVLRLEGMRSKRLTATRDRINTGDSVSRKFGYFGWTGLEVNGHHYNKIIDVLEHGNMWARTNNKPVFITAYTTKGKGVSFMENNNLYHYKQLSEEEYIKANEELNG